MPITKSINSGIAMGDMNNVVRKKKYGASSSEKNQRMGYAAGIQKIDPHNKYIIRDTEKVPLYWIL